MNKVLPFIALLLVFSCKPDEGVESDQPEINNETSNIKSYERVSNFKEIGNYRPYSKLSFEGEGNIEVVFFGTSDTSDNISALTSIYYKDEVQGPNEHFVIYNNFQQPTISYEIQGDRKSQVLKTFEWESETQFTYSEYNFDWDKGEGALRYQTIITSNDSGFSHSIIKPLEIAASSYDSIALFNSLVIRQEYTPNTSSLDEQATQIMLSPYTLNLIHTAKFSEGDYKQKFIGLAIGSIAVMYALIAKNVLLNIAEDRIAQTSNSNFVDDIENKTKSVLDRIKNAGSKIGDVLPALSDLFGKIGKNIGDNIESWDKVRTVTPNKFYNQKDLKLINISGKDLTVVQGEKSKKLVVKLQDNAGEPIDDVRIRFKFWKEYSSGSDYIGSKYYTTQSDGTISLNVNGLDEEDLLGFHIEAKVTNTEKEDGLWTHFNVAILPPSLIGTWAMYERVDPNILTPTKTYKVGSDADWLPLGASIPPHDCPDLLYAQVKYHTFTRTFEENKFQYQSNNTTTRTYTYDWKYNTGCEFNGTPMYEDETSTSDGTVSYSYTESTNKLIITYGSSPRTWDVTFLDNDTLELSNASGNIQRFTRQ